MTKIELRYHHTNNRGHVYYKPVDDDDGGRGPTLLVNQTLVSEHFRGTRPEHARLTLIVDND